MGDRKEVGTTWMVRKDLMEIEGSSSLEVHSGTVARAW
jgi:hypothetical protein